MSDSIRSLPDMSIYHPWRELRRRTHLTLTLMDLPDDQRGCLRGDRVEINIEDLQAQRRCTLAHELVHDERRVFPVEPVLRAREEESVERIAARRLIELEQLVDVLRWTRSTSEMAAELWVDVPMLCALVRSLTDDERRWIDEQIGAA